MGSERAPGAAAGVSGLLGVALAVVGDYHLSRRWVLRERPRQQRERGQQASDAAAAVAAGQACTGRGGPRRRDKQD